MVSVYQRISSTILRKENILYNNKLHLLQNSLQLYFGIYRCKVIGLLTFPWQACLMSETTSWSLIQLSSGPPLGSGSDVKTISN